MRRVGVSSTHIRQRSARPSNRADLCRTRSNLSPIHPAAHSARRPAKRRHALRSPTLAKHAVGGATGPSNIPQLATVNGTGNGTTVQVQIDSSSPLGAVAGAIADLQHRVCEQRAHDWVIHAGGGRTRGRLHRRTGSEARSARSVRERRRRIHDQRESLARKLMTHVCLHFECRAAG
jgi:hypothetical protein